MAITYNPILQGLSGKVGRVVVRQLYGKTIIQAAPVRKAPPTAGESANRENFKKAVAYAKQARLNPALWEIYLAEAKLRGGTSNAFAVAVSDFRNSFQLRKKKLAAGPQLKDNRPVKASFVFQFTSGRLPVATPGYRCLKRNTDRIKRQLPDHGSFMQLKAPPETRVFILKRN